MTERPDANVANDTVDECDDEFASFITGHEIVDGYRAWQTLGSGPRCETWLVWSDRLRLPVALKIPAHDQHDHPSPRMALTREVEALRLINHPAFPRLLDADLTGTLPYMATEYIEGPTLAATIADDGPFPPAEAAVLGAQIAIALGHLHELGLVHHDVKTHNVMLRDGRVTVIDLGFVERSGVAPLPGGPRGTDAYMAPEHRRCEPNIAGSDIYSLGLLLLEIVTGEVDSDSADAADGTWASGRLEALMRSGDLALATLARAIAILCAEDQAERPQGCDAVLATLRPSLPGNDVPWPDFVERRWATKAPTETDNTEDPAERRVLIPWIATWTSESESTTWSRPFDESLDPMGAAVLDHELVDEANELWPAATRVVSELGGRQGVGQPIFNRLHPARQRRAMLEGRCSVCGTVLAAPWTFVGHVTDDGRTPAFREPPLCGVCLPQALAACPGLRAFLEAGKLSIVTVDGYMPVADLGETDDPTAPVEHLLAIPAENGWHLNLLTGRDVANGAR